MVADRHDDWGYEPTPDDNGWLRLTGALSGAYVHSQIARIAARDLTSDPIRKVREYRLRRLQATFDPSKVGTILVSQRSFNERVVIEGNHRLVVVRDRLKMTDFLFRCEVYKHLTKAQEAFLWGAEEDRLRPTPMEDLIGQVQERVPEALAVERAVKAHGVNLRGDRSGTGDGQSWPFVESAVALEQGFSLYGERVLSEAVGYAMRAWGAQVPKLRTAFDGYVLLGLTYLLGAYGGRIDRKRLDERLASTTPRAIRETGLQFQKMHNPRIRNSLAQCCAATIVSLYNYRLSAHALDEWAWVR
jgi:hypothetical protein